MVLRTAEAQPIKVSKAWDTVPKAETSKVMMR